jgi:hypothetical protein
MGAHSRDVWLLEEGRALDESPNLLFDGKAPAQLVKTDLASVEAELGSDRPRRLHLIKSPKDSERLRRFCRMLNDRGSPPCARSEPQWPR